MNIAVISYSYTGNNEVLANNVAKQLSAEHILLSESKPRTIGSIALDMFFKSRIPQVKPAPDRMKKYDLILFIGPVWMGQVAAPFRTYLKELVVHPKRYGFISLSGGADSTNPKLAGELKKRTGANPAVLIDLHIADLLPTAPKPTRKDTSAYRLNEGEAIKLTSAIMKELGKIV